ncbi:hypothetical protein BDD12DRAFT_809042 [Trichophaea hybrida]|nr:hypothetical protein BDD12DRAFT_809042 [Trichophaea hybrida]
MDTNLDRQWKKMIALGDQALSTKCQILQMTVPNRNILARPVFVTSEYLEEEAKDEELYYTNYKYADILFHTVQYKYILNIGTQEKMNMILSLSYCKQSSAYQWRFHYERPTEPYDMIFRSGSSHWQMLGITRVMSKLSPKPQRVE